MPYSMMYSLWDPTYILILIGMVLCLAASAYVKLTFSRYKDVRSSSSYTGSTAADRILKSQGIFNVAIQRIAGDLTDHYSPGEKSLALSDSVYGSNSIAAIAVAAHECGHAIQDARSYALLSIRSSLVPVVNIASGISWPLILVGFFLRGDIARTLMVVGILLFSSAVLFQLITLPVEIDASRRALIAIRENGLLSTEEQKHAKKVLTAAALTYVASLAAVVLQLIRLIWIARSNDD